MAILGSMDEIIKMSQIRRMCRLLANVCNSKTQNSSDGSTGKLRGKERDEGSKEGKRERKRVCDTGI